MATKTTEKDEAPEAEAPSQDSPLLDLSDAAVRAMIKRAKKRGYVTMDEINNVLPSESVDGDQIEDGQGDHRWLDSGAGGFSWAM